MKFKTKKKLFFTAIVAVPLLIVAASFIRFPKAAPVKFDPKAKPADTMAFIASDKFKNMPLEDQKAYLKAMRENRRNMPRPQNAQNGQIPRRPPMDNLSEEQRKAAFANMRKAHEAEMNERLDKFFAMSKEEQLAELDKRIAERKQFAKDNPNARRRGNRGNANNAKPDAGKSAATAEKPAAASQSGAKTETAEKPAAQTQNERKRPSSQDMREHYEASSPALRTKMRAYFTMQRLREQGKL